MFCCVRMNASRAILYPVAVSMTFIDCDTLLFLFILQFTAFNLSFLCLCQSHRWSWSHCVIVLSIRLFGHMYGLPSTSSLFFVIFSLSGSAVDQTGYILAT